MQTLEASRTFADNYGVNVFESYGFSFPYPFTQPMYPVLSVLFYAFTVFYFTPDDPEAKPTAKSRSSSSKPVTLTPFKIFCLIHNGLLCAFSWLVFINVFPEVMGKIQDWGSYACSPSSQNEMYWGYLFYLSKIWEFIDTWILLWKGRKPSTLQVYHHIGAVFACWLQVIVGGTSYWVFMCWNSFIHTVMYGYYCATTLGYRFKFKFMITILQLSQFIIGESMAFYQWWMYPGCYRTEDLWVYVFNALYVWPLVPLFLNFFIQTYCGKKVKTV